MTMHIEEKVLEKFVINPESFNDLQRNFINEHLSSCSKCLEVYNLLHEIYSEYENNLIKLSDKEDVILHDKLLEQIRQSSKKLLPAGDKELLVKFYNNTSISKFNHFFLKIYRYYIVYPVRSISITFIFVFMLILSFNSLKNTFFKDRNPFYLTKESAFIKVYNKSGEFLWQVFAGDLPDEPLDSLMDFSINKNRKIYLEDIDNDNKNELLITGGNKSDVKLFSSDTLYCFNYDGTLRWKTFPESKEFIYAPHWRRTKWGIKYFNKVVTKNGVKLFLLALDRIYAGTVMSLIDPITGKILSSTYLAGHTVSLLIKDIDNDGFDEIIVGGFSTYKKPRIAILKTDYFMGVLPDFYSEKYNLIKGNALYFILLPNTELCEKLQTISNRFVLDLFENKTYGGFTAVTSEIEINNKYYGLMFAFDSLVTCRHISTNKQYTDNYYKYFENKIVSAPLDSITLENLKKEILYWDGDQFVKYPAKNKYWNQPFILPDGRLKIASNKD